MPLVPDLLKKQIEATLITALTRELGAEGGSDPSSHQKLAAAISDIAIPIIAALTTQAQVQTTVATSGGPGTGVGTIV